MKSKLSIFLLITNLLLLSVLLIVWIPTLDTFSSYPVYISTGKVSFLTPDAGVFYKGIRIGKVMETSIEGQNLIIKLRISREVKLPDDIEVFNILDSEPPGILFRKGTDQKLIESGDTLFRPILSPFYSAVSQNKSDRDAQFGILIEQFSSTVERMNGLLGTVQPEGNFSEIVTNLSVYSRELTEMARELNNSYGKAAKNLTILSEEQQKYLQAQLSHSEKQDKKIQKILDNYLESSQKLQDYSEKMQTIAVKMETVIEAVNSDSGSLGKLIHDKELYNSLKKASLELNRLIQDFRKNPRQFFDSSVF